MEFSIFYKSIMFQLLISKYSSLYRYFHHHFHEIILLQNRNLIIFQKSNIFCKKQAIWQYKFLKTIYCIFDGEDDISVLLYHNILISLT